MSFLMEVVCSRIIWGLCCCVCWASSFFIVEAVDCVAYNLCGVCDDGVVPIGPNGVGVLQYIIVRWRYLL